MHFFLLISFKFLSFQSTPKTSTSSVMMNIMKETMIMIRTWKMYELDLSIVFFFLVGWGGRGGEE